MHSVAGALSSIAHAVLRQNSRLPLFRLAAVNFTHRRRKHLFSFLSVNSDTGNRVYRVSAFGSRKPVRLIILGTCGTWFVP